MPEEVQAAPAVRVAQDLTAIADLCERLLTQAVHTANDRELPGGEAMVALGPVADPHAYAENVEAAETRHLTDPKRWPALDLSHEDDDLAPVTQVLWFWTDDIRTRLGYPLDGRRATPATEANVLRHALDWLWDNDPHFDDLAADIRGARRRLENILHDGERAELGVHCPTCEHYGRDAPRLILRYDDRDATGQGDEYRCPGDWQHRWKVDDYRRWVGAVYVAHADRLTADDLANTYDIAPGTIRRWASKRTVDGEELPPLLPHVGRSHDGRKMYSVATAVALRDGKASGLDGRMAG